MINYFPSQNRTYFLVFLIKSAENLFEHRVFDCKMPWVTPLIRVINLKIYYFVGGLATTETWRRKSEIREKLCKVLWKAEKWLVRLWSFLKGLSLIKIFPGVLQSTSFICSSSETDRETNTNSLLLGLFQDQTIDLHFSSCIKTIASTFVLLWQEQDDGRQLLLSQQQLDGYSLWCVRPGPLMWEQITPRNYNQSKG